MLSDCRYDIQERTRCYCGESEKVLPIPLKRLAFMLAVATLIAACGESHPTVQTSTVNTFSRIQVEIFTPSCAVSGCHDTSTHKSGLNLSAGNAYVQIVNIPSTELPTLKRVAPSDLNNSYLFQKINGTANIKGLQMPLGASPLNSDQINLVRDWILSGAPND
jgi:hypothetical protein